MDKKHKMLDHKENDILYCENCYSEWEKKQTQKAEKERIAKLDKILSKNNRWEYLVKKVNTAFGGSIKTEDSELDILGQEGWELVGITAVNQSNFIAGQVVTLIMVFKRKLT
ncbi:DUF4177 domain-containing protein [Candidatus Woesearchaeota archaeon]|nr:DUF4177 domain-containing protein [Candidatus Woesearchaeota archaeon]